MEGTLANPPPVHGRADQMLVSCLAPRASSCVQEGPSEVPPAVDAVECAREKGALVRRRGSAVSQKRVEICAVPSSRPYVRIVTWS